MPSLPLTLSLFGALASASAIGVFATRLARDSAVRWGHYDLPDDRKVHTLPTPRVGGVGIAVGVGAGLACLVGLDVFLGLPTELGGLVVVAAGASVVFALGLWDDLVGLSFKWRFVVQAGVAWAMTLFGWRVDLSHVPLLEALGPFEQAAIAVPLTVVWTVGLINAVNLLDGLDTLAGGTAVIGFAALAAAFYPGGDVTLLAICAVGVGATLGFLSLNRAPASVFMGDGGSTLLGFLLAMASVRGVGSMASGSLVFLPVVALGLPILDTLTQMVRRIADGKSPFLPDRDHLHHRAFDRSGDVRVAVRKLHLTAVGFGLLAVMLRLVVGHLWAQAVVILATLGFGYYVVRRLGYVRTRRIVRSVRTRVMLQRARKRREALLASTSRGPTGAAPFGDGPADDTPSGDGVAVDIGERVTLGPRSR